MEITISRACRMSIPRRTSANLYQYDPLDRLISAHTVQRFYNNTRIATEIQGERKTCFFEHESMPLAELNLGGSITLLATVQQKTVLHSIHQALIHQHAYSPYGHRSVEDELLSLLGFNGERPDSVTGHYLLGQGHRAYNPVLMRFNSPDSLSPFGKGGINAYAYCGNDPINCIDPSGGARLFFFPRRLFNQSNVPDALSRVKKSLGSIIKITTKTTALNIADTQTRQTASSSPPKPKQPTTPAANRVFIERPNTRSRTLVPKTTSTTSNNFKATDSSALSPIHNYAGPDQWAVQLTRAPLQPVALPPIRNYATPGSWEVRLAPDPMQPRVILIRTAG